MRAGRPMPTPVRQAVHSVMFAFSDDLHAAVIQVLHPALKSKPDRQPPAFEPEAHALDPSLHRDMDPRDHALKIPQNRGRDNTGLRRHGMFSRQAEMAKSLPP